MAQLFSSLLLFCNTVFLVSATSTSTISVLNNATDHQSLLSFKSALSNGPTGPLSSWNSSTHFCRWPGVYCSGLRHPQRVVELVLSSLGLTGSISPAIANLTFLRNVDLSNNQLHGQIPEDIGRLVQLQNLNLSMNSLQGGIPSALSQCSQLQSISLGHNCLTGEIPPGLGSCSNLKNLILSNNSLTGNLPSSLTNLSSLSVLTVYYNQISGSIPATIGNLLNLTYLSLAYNEFTGGIPPSIGQLSKLTVLGLPHNNLSGSVPPSLWNLSSLSRISLAYNQLSGSLPENFGQFLPLVEYIDLYWNQIHGPLPMSLSNATSLRRMDFSYNRFSGEIPSNLGNLESLEWLTLQFNEFDARGPNGWNFLSNLSSCTNLVILNLDSNNLGGMLPRSIANLSANLETLALQNNGISGSITPEIGNLVGLTNLDLGPNLLHGSIPDSIGMLQNLRALDLDDNKLSGEIPSSLGNLTQLIELFLDYNQLTGVIPASLGNCQNLNLLNLDLNKLTGGIPKEILNISTLSRYLGLAYNSLTGPLPSEVGNLNNLEYFDISLNKLTGKIPSSIGNCLVLEQVYLQGNLFCGSIPSSFSALRGIQELNFSQNNFSGTIPDFFQDFRFLYSLDLSFNSFEGAVPRSGVFANISAVSVTGNSKLCGGNPKLQLPACPSLLPNHKKHNPRKLLVIMLALSIVLFVLFCFLVVCCRIRKSTRKHQDPTPENEQGRLSYNVLVKATNGFSTDNLVGSGGFGAVYKGTLDNANDRTEVVAVKVLNLQLQEATKSFIAECEAMRNIRHRNLVKVLTTCSTIDFRGNEFKAVVYEFMANGNLDDWLHPKANDLFEPKRLSLMQRLNIAIDVASALDYLHHYGEVPIVHCDLKPSNILLDDDMTAHVGDFGLARFLRNVASKSSQFSASSVGLKGTVGYIPPEYGIGNKASTSGDVYSYGILLLEMFTAKRPTHDNFTEGLSLRKFVGTVFPQRIEDVIDEHLLFQDDTEEESDYSTRAMECMTSVIRIGMLCSNEVPGERLETGNIVREHTPAMNLGPMP